VAIRDVENKNDDKNKARKNEEVAATIFGMARILPG
jgi:hypothetical protein